MKPWLVVLLKELKDASRDRRALVSLLIFPVIGPLMIYFMFTTIIDLRDEALDIELPVAGAEYAPDLIDFLQQNGIRINRLELAADAGDNQDPNSFSTARSAEIRRAIELRSYDFALLVPADFSEHLAQGQTVNVELHMDGTRNTAGPGIGRVQNLIEAWGRETAVLRLLTRGINNEFIRPVNVSRIDVATAQSRAQSIMGMVSMFIIMAAFASGVGIAVDATAGERERKSLEPLLVNPVSRFSIVLGKWLAAVLFSMGGLLIVMTLNLLVLGRVPLEEIGLTLIIGPQEVIGMLLVVLPLAFFATSLQIFVGNFARSFKDAQIYISLLMLLPILPFMYTSFNNPARQSWMNLVPMLGQNMLLTDVVSGRMPATGDFAVAAGMLLAASMVLIALATGLLGRERIIFS